MSSSSKCLFCSIVKENKPFHEFIWRDKKHVAFLDAYPLKDGHTLLVPRQHVSYLFDLSEGAYVALWKKARMIARLLKNTFHTKRVCVMVEGYSIPHAHIHLIPSNRGLPIGGLSRKKPTARKMASIARRLRGRSPA